MDVFGEHAVHYASEVGGKCRHDLVRDVLMDICYKASVAARKEVSMGLLSDQNVPLKPADIMVYNWENGRDTCFDLMGTSPFSGSGTRSFTPGRAISIVVARKNIKYLDI